MNICNLDLYLNTLVTPIKICESMITFEVTTKYMVSKLGNNVGPTSVDSVLQFKFPCKFVINTKTNLHALNFQRPSVSGAPGQLPGNPA